MSRAWMPSMDRVDTVYGLSERFGNDRAQDG
jgi:hypothetical protein